MKSFQFITRLPTHADSMLTFMKQLINLTCVDSNFTGSGHDFLTRLQESTPRINKSLSCFSNPFLHISSHLMPDDQLGVDMWRNTHFVYECTVKTATADVSPYKKHALSQNSLSSSQSHALLMIRREKDSETVFPSVTAGSPCVCLSVCLCACVSDCTKINRWIWLQPIIRSRANQTADHDCAAATGSLARALSSRHDNNLWLAAIWSSPSEVYYLSYFVHNNVSHDAIISSLFLTQHWCLE